MRTCVCCSALVSVNVTNNSILAVLSLLKTFHNTHKGKDIKSLLRVHDVTTEQI